MISRKQLRALCRLHGARTMEWVHPEMNEHLVGKLSTVNHVSWQALTRRGQQAKKEPPT